MRGTPGTSDSLFKQIFCLTFFTFLKLFNSAVTRGFKKPHGMALELVYRAENRCKSSGAPAGAFPMPPRAPPKNIKPFYCIGDGKVAKRDSVRTLARLSVQPVL